MMTGNVTIYIYVVLHRYNLHGEWIRTCDVIDDVTGHVVHHDTDTVSWLTSETHMTQHADHDTHTSRFSLIVAISILTAFTLLSFQCDCISRQDY